MEKVDKETLSWLHVPATDINFQSRLQGANIETCKAALKEFTDLSKLARKKIESRIKHLSKPI